MARILIVTQYYPPEMGAAAVLTSDIAKVAAAAGHHVDVMTAFPNYPTGRITAGYRRRLFVRERDGAVTVHRVWVFVRPSRTAASRIATYLSFAVSAILASVLVKRPTVVIANSPPLPVALAAAVIARVRGARLVVNIEDIWPQAAVEIGAVSRRGIIRLATAAEEWTYRQAALVAGQTVGITRDIQSRVGNGKVVVFPAGADTALFTPDDADPFVARELGINPELFTIGYAGLHGLWQSLDTVLDAAGLLLDHGGIQFVLIGDGPTKRRLEKRVAAERLANVRLLPPQPVAQIARLMPLWGAGVVPLISAPLTRGAVPVKIYELMASGVPVVFNGHDGEAAELIRRFDCGITTAAGDPRSIVNAILRLHQDAANATRLGRNGRTHAIAHLDRQMRIRDLLDVAVAGG